MKRRGVLSVVMVMELIFVAILLVLFGSITSTASETEKIQEVVAAEDLALLINSIQSTPYDIHYEYPESLFGKNISIEGTTISVFDAFGAGPLPGSFFYGRTFSKLSNIKFPARQTISGAFFTVTKKGNTMTFDDYSSNGNQEVINPISIRKKEDLIIFVDYEDSGVHAQNIILENLRDKTKTELALASYIIANKQLANLDIIFTFENETVNQGKNHKISHSLALQGETEFLARSLGQDLTTRMSLPTRVEPKSFGNRATISFDFLETPRGIMDINNPQLQSILAQSIVLQLDQVFGGAHP